MHVNLINYGIGSEFNDNYLKGIIEFIIKGYKKYLPTFSIYYSKEPFNTDIGQIDYTSPKIAWDGTSVGNGNIYITFAVSRPMFPLIYSTNEELAGDYFRNIITLRNKAELLFFLTAHEIYHQIRFKNLNFRLLHKSLKIDEEGEADIFALSKLLKWRKTLNV